MDHVEGARGHGRAPQQLLAAMATGIGQLMQSVTMVTAGNISLPGCAAEH